MKPIPKLDVDLSWIVEVETPKRQTVVEQDSPVRHVQRCQRNRIFLGEAFPQRYVKCRVPGQVSAGKLRKAAPVGESRAVVHIGRCERLPRKACGESHVEGVPLVVINRG